MRSSIATDSVQNPSIFSHSESYWSAETQWTSETSIKLSQTDRESQNDGQEKQSRPMGRPRNKWSCSRLRKLTRLYLLTDLELDGIINLLKTEDFQPCSRNVQVKLNLLLQPQPNKIRVKGDTKVLRNILRDCRKLQRTRRTRKQQHKYQLEQKRNSHEGCSGSPGDERGITILNSDNATHTSDFSLVFLDPIDYEETSEHAVPSRVEAPLSLLEESYSGSKLKVDAEWAFPEFTTALDSPGPSLDWNLTDFGLQPEHLDSPQKENNSNPLMHYPSSITDIYGEIDGIKNPTPDFGFDSDFGSNLVQSVPKSSSIPSPMWASWDFSPGSEIDDKLCRPIVPQYSKPCPNSCYKLPVVNSRHTLLSEYSYHDFDAIDPSFFEVEPSPSSILDLPGETECSSFKSSVSEPGDLLSEENISKRSFTGSGISEVLSKMSLGGSTSHSPTSADGFDLDSAFPIILPGTFPEYCWEHINENKLRLSTFRDGQQKCNSKQHMKATPNYRSLRADVLSRIVQRTVRAADILEIDTFGNSTIHISATLLAPPSYLITLIKMGANINGVNSAGQTFLHLIKPEALTYCDDFCSLLEILTDQGFNFSQHDHLGQSPLHLLMRPWINPDILGKIITKLDSLPIHSHFSTMRDCSGQTVVGQMNLQANEFAPTDLDQAIFSLACETEKPIVDPKDLQIPRVKSRRNRSRSRDELTGRNYENHPPIKNVDDLLQYEQHVDNWRTIVTATDSPWFEDSSGRNGLHCLAQAYLVSADLPLPSLLLNQLESLKRLGHAGDSNERECFLRCLLSAGVDPNNYDKDGNTPFMAFIIHHRAAESDDCITRSLNCLLDVGSDIRRRNRRGETALHLAVKLGCRAATKVLLTSGANVHVRTSSGLGVLELAQKYLMQSREDECMYSQIILCMSLAASFGAVAEPSILDEWALPKWKIGGSSKTEPKGFNLVKKFIAKKAHGRKRK